MTCCCEEPSDPNDPQDSKGSKDPSDPKSSESQKEPVDQNILPDWKKVFVSRHEFLKALGFALSGLIGLLVAIPGLGFALNYFFLPKREGWVKVGAVENFTTGTTVNVVFENPGSLPWDGVTARNSAWLRRDADDKFLAFAINCTHLGCPVRWEDAAKLFLCPCHGGVYDSSGDVAGGPPPRPLHRYPVRIEKGQVEISIRPVLDEI